MGGGLMGAHLVTLALSRWAPHISDTAFRVLVRMAVTALDNEGENGRPARVYFGGRELLAMTLRTQGGSPKTAHKRVQKAIAELIGIGAIERLGAAYNGQRQAYRLILTELSTGRKGGPTDPPLGGSTDPPLDEKGGSVESLKGGPTDPPKEPGGTTTDLERCEEDVGRPPTQVQTAREDRREQAECSCGVVLDPDGSCFMCGPRLVHTVNYE
jgi:hypothetical protein